MNVKWKFRQFGCVGIGMKLKSREVRERVPDNFFFDERYTEVAIYVDISSVPGCTINDP